MGDSVEGDTLVGYDDRGLSLLLLLGFLAILTCESLDLVLSSFASIFNSFASLEYAR